MRRRYLRFIDDSYDDDDTFLEADTVEQFLEDAN